MTLILLPGPLAENGDKQEIPLLQDSALPNRMSYDRGTPPICSEDPNEGGLPPRRKDINQVHYMFSNNFYELQKGILYTFDPYMATAPQTGYPNGAVLWDFGTQQFVVSNKNNNTDNFVETPSFIGISWIPTAQSAFDGKLNTTGDNASSPAILRNMGLATYKWLTAETPPDTLDIPGTYSFFTADPHALGLPTSNTTADNIHIIVFGNAVAGANASNPIQLLTMQNSARNSYFSRAKSGETWLPWVKIASDSAPVGYPDWASQVSMGAGPSYTCPSDGWIFLIFATWNGNMILAGPNYKINGVSAYNACTSARDGRDGGGINTMLLPVKEGDIVTADNFSGFGAPVFMPNR